MPERGNLKKYLRITEHGRNYLEKIESTLGTINYSSVLNHNASEDAPENSNAS